MPIFFNEQYSFSVQKHLLAAHSSTFHQIHHKICYTKHHIFTAIHHYKYYHTKSPLITFNKQKMGLQAKLIIFLAFTSSFLFSSCISVASNATTLPEASNFAVGSDKVNVNFYYESLCTSCRNLITGYLGHLYRNFGSVLNLRLIPWGNARIVNGNFACQFGPDECYLNTVQACAIHRWPDLQTHLQFIQCSSNAYKDWTVCVTEETARELQQCAKSNLGKNLGLAFAYETQNLNPPHEFIPWVTVNNYPLRKDIFNLAWYICKVYKGPDPPAACEQEARISDGKGKDGENKLELETCKKD